ncbi:MAG: DNA topoisomerase IB [Jatrophihabitans sp.]|uniref:DNA topoisomerase IB n=1 Tax=Jatrophihabitans sp. TaxID=1932789 RepID=UPI003F7FED30
MTAAVLRALLSDNEACAKAAGLHYVDRTVVPGYARLRCGRGFRYLDEHGRKVDAETKSRIVALAIPPAWRDVWVCTDNDAHLLATGVDDRGRRQYLYHEKWRGFRDLVNFYRLTEVGRQLPGIRDEVDRQLRRRTLDRERMLAAMLRMIDLTGIRVGNETYADENDTIGLCTLQKKHVTLEGRTMRLSFPAKSGKQADLVVGDPAVVRVVEQLMQRRGRRLFTLDNKAVTAEEINEKLHALTDFSMTAKDFRTWLGTVTAFTVLRHALDAEDREKRVVEAVDAAAATLSNTRAVARAHYVHPHVLDTYLDGTMADYLERVEPVEAPELQLNEQELLGYLDLLLAEHGKVLPVPAA